MRPAILALTALSALAGACSDSATSNPEKACDEVAAATCDKLSECAPAELLALYGDLAGCAVRVRLRCQPMLDAAGSRTLPATAEECAVKLRAAGCDVFSAHNLPAACYGAPGSLADGASCAVGAQCESSYCKVPSNAACGVCTRRATSGGACSEEDGCAPTLACAKSVCVPFGGVSSPCNQDHPCQRDLICRGGSCARPLEAGQPCDVLTQECNLQQGLYCGKSKLCGQASTAKAGEPCGVLPGGEVAICSGGARCSTNVNGLCQAPAPDGGACDPAKGPYCVHPATCVGGVCVLPDGAGCK
jgi:hypothetical protein